MFIKSKSSNVLYKLLSTEENKLENKLFIVEDIAWVILIFNCSKLTHPFLGN